LRVAHGDVRCGICATTFNALENLSEQSFEPVPAAAEAPSPDDSMTVEELPGSENIELSSGSEPPPEEAPAEPGDDAALEFHGDAADLDRLFVVESPEPEPQPDSDLERTDEYPILVLDEQDLPAEAEQPAEPEDAPADVPEDERDDTGESIVLAAEEGPPPFTAPRILIPEEMRQRLAEEAEARANMTPEFGLDDADDQRRRWPWAVAAGALLLLFGAQVVHSQRDQLVRRAGVGPLVAQAYDLLGLPLAVPTDLSAYELRQWGAASDPNEADRLLLRASIVNRAPYAQPYPLLRLALQDRFGATLGIRDIAPADYLPGAGAPGLLRPGERADAEVRIVDPGKEAVGFEMDVCVTAGDGVRCASQVAAAAQ
jgi:hypothetical protein